VKWKNKLLINRKTEKLLLTLFMLVGWLLADIFVPFVMFQKTLVSLFLFTLDPDTLMRALMEV